MVDARLIKPTYIYSFSLTDLSTLGGKNAGLIDRKTQCHLDEDAKPATLWLHFHCKKKDKI